MPKWETVLDDFPGSALGVNWYGTYGTFTVAGGQVDIDNVGYAGIITFGNDLSDSSVFMKMAVGGATGGHAYLGLRDAGDVQIAGLFLTLGDNLLQFELGTGDLTTVAYNAATMAYWRFRHAAETLFWETSPDGAAWTVRRSAAYAGASLTDINLRVEGGPWPTTGTGVVSVSKLNIASGAPTNVAAVAVGSVATVPAPVVSGVSDSQAAPAAVGAPAVVPTPTIAATAATKWGSYQDVFDGGSLGSLWASQTGTVTVVGNRVGLGAAATATTIRLDLSESTVFLAAQPAATGVTAVRLVNASAVVVASTYLSGANLVFQLAVGEGAPPSVVYDPVAMKFWRFRHAGANGFWETSPEGATWTVRRTAALSAAAVAAVAVKLESAAATSYFSSLNLSETPAGVGTAANSTLDVYDDNDLAVLAGVTVGAGAPPVAVPVSPGQTGQFQTSQGIIWDPNGVQFTPVGVSLMGPNGFWAERAADLQPAMLEDFGFNTVRVVTCDPGGCACCTARTVLTNDTLNDIVAVYTARKMVVIVDYHQIASGVTPTAGQIAAAEVFWRDLARRFGANPYVWFGLVDEPDSGAGAIARWLSLHQQLVNAVRAENGQNVLVVNDTHGGVGTSVKWSVTNLAAGQSAVIDVGATLLDPASRLVWDLHAWDEWGAPSNLAGTILFADSQREAKLRDYLTRATAGGRPVIVGALGFAGFEQETTGTSSRCLETGGCPQTGSGQRLAAKAVYALAREQSLGVIAWGGYALSVAGFDPAILTTFGDWHRTYAIGHATYVDPPPRPGGSPAAAITPTGRFEVAAGKIYNPEGGEFIPVGTSLMGPNGFWIDNPASVAVADSVEAWGFNTVRIVTCGSAGCRCCTASPVYTNANDLSAIVGQYTTRGIVVIVDYHHLASGRTPDAADMAAAESFWRAQAQAYKANPLVWFGLFNEPEQGAGSAARWVSQHQQIINAIRAETATNLILVNDSWAGQGTSQLWNVDPLPGGHSAVLDSGGALTDTQNRLVYELHAYDSWGAPSNLAGTVRHSQAQRTARLRDYITRARVAGRALVIGEVGFFDWEQETTGVSNECALTGAVCPPTGSASRLAAKTVYDLAIEQRLGVIAWNGFELSANRGWSLTARTQFGDAHYDYAGRVGRLTKTGPFVPPVGGGGGPVDLVAILKKMLTDDMTLPHEALLEGVPAGYSWGSGPRLGAGNNPGVFTAALPWGEIYAAAAGVGSTNTMVNIRNLNMAILSASTGQWTVIKSTNGGGNEGGYYAADFAGPNGPASPILLPDGSLAAKPGGGYNFHYYSNSRASINPNDIAGVVAWHEARLIKDDPNGPDDRALARFLAGTGGDYWRDLNAPFVGDFSNNGDFAIGRHRFLTSEWQTFTAHSLTAVQIANNPPPISLADGSIGPGGPIIPPPPPPPPPPTGDHAARLNAQLKADMTQPHTGVLEGVPLSYDWGSGPRVGMGNNPGSFTAAVPWGEIYGDQAGIRSTNTLVNIRNLNMAVLSRATGQWTVIKSTNGGAQIDGGYYTNDFQGNITNPAPIGQLADGSRTAKPGNGYNFHYYPAGRSTINNGDIAGIIAWHEARLIVDNPGGPDDRSQARFLCGAGGDYWADLNAGWPNNGDFAIGRHRHLTTEWQTFTAHSLTFAQIDANPPPVVLAGGTVAPPPPPPPPPPTGAWTRPLNRAIKVNFMGDSTTNELAENGDLAGIPARMTGFGYQTTLVGTVTASDGTKHDGRGAWCIDDVNNRCTHNNGFHSGGYIQNAAGYLGASVPDVIVVHLGINDGFVQVAYSDVQTGEAMGRLLDIIRSAAPQAMTLVSKLRFGWDLNPTVNAQFLNVVNAKAAAGQNVRLIDVNATLNAGDYTDGVHQTAGGRAKVITAQADALKTLFDSASGTTTFVAQTNQTQTVTAASCANAVQAAATGPGLTALVQIASQADLTARGLPGTWNASLQLWNLTAMPAGGVIAGYRVLGGIYYTGAAPLVIEDCEIRNTGPSFALVHCAPGAGPPRLRRCKISRPTVDPTVALGAAAVVFAGQPDGWVEYCDISGNADGISLNGDRHRLFRNWVHALTPSLSTVNDGIHIAGGGGHDLIENRVELATSPGRDNACIYLNGVTVRAVNIAGNLLSGSGWQIAAADGQLTVTGNCLNSPRLHGAGSISGNATIVLQSGNTSDGVPAII